MADQVRSAERAGTLTSLALRWRAKKAPHARAHDARALASRAGTSRPQVRNPDSGADYTPIVEGLEEVDVNAAAKKVTTMYEQRSLIYFFNKEKGQWITRGKGNIKIIKHADSPVYQMVLYEEKTLKLRLCAVIPPPPSVLTANEGSDRTWTFACTDYSENKEGSVQSCAAKFKDSDGANEFKAQYEKYQAENAKASNADATPAAAASDAKGDTAEAAPAEKQEAKKEEAKKEEAKTEA